MGTEVMRPQDCLVDGLGVHPASFNRRRNVSGHGNLKNLGTHQKQNNNKEDRKTSPKNDQKKRSNPKAKNPKKSRGVGVSDSRQRDEIDLVMGQITLLRRGESFDSLAARIKDGNQQIHKSENQIPAVDVAAVQVGDVIVPESPPEMVPKKIRVEAVDTYAGSGFFLSPSPRALPVPTFFNNNKMPENNGGIVRRDTATRDLLRMLHLE